MCADQVDYGGVPATYVSNYNFVIDEAWHGADTNYCELVARASKLGRDPSTAADLLCTFCADLRCYYICADKPELRAGNSFLVVSGKVVWDPAAHLGFFGSTPPELP